MLFDLIFDAVLASFPKWAQYTIIAVCLLLVASLLGWAWYAGGLK